MSGQSSAPDSRTSLRSGLRVSTISICWTLASSTVSIVLGIVANSVVLTAFGLTGVLDAAGSITLVVHFRHALHHESVSSRHEKVALRVVTSGLFVVGTLTALASALHFVDHTVSRSTPAGIVTSGASAIVLFGLAYRKRHLGAVIPSRALVADGWLSTAGCLLGISTVAGVGLSDGFGWWWADPSTAGIVAIGAIVVAVVMGRTTDDPAHDLLALE